MSVLRTFRKIIVGFVVAIFAIATFLILLIFVVRIEENWRSQRELASCERELASKGEKLDLASFIPSPVPDAENFAMAPLVAPIFKVGAGDNANSKNKVRDPAIERLEKINLTAARGAKPSPSSGSYEMGHAINFGEWQKYLQSDKQRDSASDSGDSARAVLAWITRWSPELEEFSAAANRPYSRFPIDYSKGFAIALPHTQFLMHFAQVYCLRASAVLETADSESAFRDLETIDRIQRAIRPEPLLISHLVRLVVIKWLMQVIWQGSINHHWNERQLQQIEALLRQIDLVADYPRIIRGERAFSRDMYQQFRNQHRRPNSIISEYFTWLHAQGQFQTWVCAILSSGAILTQNRAWSERWVQDRVLPIVDVSGHRIDPDKAKDAERISRETKTTPYNFLAKLGAQIYGIPLRTAAVQVSIDEARISSALERFRIKNGDFPETLDELVPNYLTAIPSDVVNGQPLHYHRKPDGSFLIYSIGWNEIDDGGTIATKSQNSNRRDDEHGDWVWFSAPRK